VKSQDLAGPEDRTSVFKEVIPPKAEITKLFMETSFLCICVWNLGLLMFNHVHVEAFLAAGISISYLLLGRL